MKYKRLLCALLCAAVFLSALSVSGFAAFDDVIIPGAKLEAPPAVAGEVIEAPALTEDSARFHIAAYQWYRGEMREGCEVSAGERFTEGTYYLDVTVRLGSFSGCGIDEHCYLGGGTYYKEISRTVDPDASAVHTVFAVPVLPKAAASITLPEVYAGASVHDALKELVIDADTTLTGIFVYEDDALLTVCAVDRKGELVWADVPRTFREGSVYRITALAAADSYIPRDAITVTNPEAAERVTVAGDEGGVGFTAEYEAKRIPAITSVAVSGATEPVQDALPETDTSLVCADPSLYSAKILGWSTDKPFTGGQNHEISILITPCPGTVGMSAETPVTINGAPAWFVREQDGGFVFRAEFFCEAVPTVASAAVTGIVLPVDGEAPAAQAKLNCAEPELYSAKYLGWDAEKTFEGNKTYHVSVLLTAKDGVKGLDKNTPVTLNGVNAEFVRTENGGFVFRAAFFCERIPAIASAAVIGITEPAEGETPKPDDTLLWGNPELYSAKLLGWSTTEPFEGNTPYDVFVLLTAQPGTRGLCAETPVTLNGVAAEFVREENGGFVFRARFVASAAEKPPLPFRDVAESDWFHNEVEYCWRQGLMNGTSEDMFTPTGLCTRAMLVTILHRHEGSPDVTYRDVFRDVAQGTWYTDGVLWASDNGIVNGYGNGLFGTNDQITREQLAVILYRSSGSSIVAHDLSGYPDAGTVSPWAVDAMRWAVARGIIGGKPVDGENCLQPQGFATRAECAAILARFYAAAD